MGKYKCCCGCCLTVEELPTSITITPEGGDPVVLSGSWAANGVCCYRFTSTYVEIPGLTVLDLCLLGSIIEHEYQCEVNYDFIDYFDLPVGTCVPPWTATSYVNGANKTESFYERQKIYLTYKTYRGIIIIDLCHKQIACESYEPECIWTTKVTISLPDTTSDNKNRIGWRRHSEYYTFERTSTRLPEYACIHPVLDNVDKEINGEDYCASETRLLVPSIAAESSRSKVGTIKPTSILFENEDIGPCLPADDQEEFALPAGHCEWNQTYIEEDATCFGAPIQDMPPIGSLLAQRYESGGEYYFCVYHEIFGSVSTGPLTSLTPTCPWLPTSRSAASVSTTCTKPSGDELVVTRPSFTIDFTWP